MSSDQSPYILGISASHNGSVCLLKGDEIVVAVQEERLSRFKRHRLRGADASLALAYCLSYAGIESKDLSLVVLCLQGRKTDSSQDILLNPFLNVVSAGIPTITIPHHYGHAVSVFATSGFKDAAVLVVDGAGSPVADLSPEECEVIKCNAEDAWETISLYAASDTAMVPLEKQVVAQGGWLNFNERGMPGFGSLGGIFSAVAQQIFGDAAEAGKVMGLAPYGNPEMPASDFFDINDCGFHFKEIVPARFPHDERYPARQAEYENLSSSAQAALEEALLHLVRRLRRQSASENLCYAGGVALNSVANERIIREGGFKAVYIMPAADDSGPALGAAYHGLWTLTKTNTRKKLLHDSFGRRYPPAEVSTAIAELEGLSVSRPPDLIAEVVDLLCDGKMIGWFDGGSELGPRALGQRSIICDPRRAEAKEVLNRLVKRREPFRPFAPVILLEEVENWFDLDGTRPESPFMLRVCPFKPDRVDAVAAVVHVDQTGRLQTVSREVNGRFYDLVKRFYEKTGVPMILNTSFNVMGEPIVETPADALACLINTGLDCCVFEDRIVFKASSPSPSSVTQTV
jgi:carbamoyltransferase